ncbi:hypothetical protein CU044_2556 [Streptomyces sp. L-9-10]|uniref:hypothetical protein n=1 Tax=Streptomyces sp. L-9-10 TaxID=1478131 RepID=UPI00101C8133|nr:hypothetical protein [Streptomyces sp. L-9-10]RYJ28795.1 hypothetical protein CU044_2556 [Streptomyces sp. L-9-10]
MNSPGSPDQNQRLLWLLLAAVLALIFTGLTYVTYLHPSLAVPLTVATSGTVAVLTALGFALSCG